MDVAAVNRPYKTAVLAVADVDRISVLAVEERAAVRCVVSTDGPKKEGHMLRLLLCVMKMFWVKLAELSAEKLFNVVDVVGHKARDSSAERDAVFGLDCGQVDVDFALTKKTCCFTATLLFLAMAIIAPTSAAATSKTARQTAMKHRTVGTCHLSIVCRGRSAALSTFSRMRV